MPGGRGREAWGLVRVFAGGVLAFLSGVTGRGGRDGRKRAASLTWVRGAQAGAPAAR